MMARSLIVKYPIKIGVVCLARHTFDTEAAAQAYQVICQRLSQMPSTTFELVEELVVDIEDARRVADKLASRQVDGLVLMSGTFHLGHLVLELCKGVPKPCLLWALDELPYDGGKIRLNSVCGVNLDASNLYKAGLRNYQAAIGGDIDQDWLDALRVDKCLSQARVGLAGHHAHGFFNLSVHGPSAYARMGTLLDHFELKEIWDFPVTDSAVAEQKDRLLDTFARPGVSDDQVQKVSRLAAALRSLFDRHGLSALAIRCWPEFAANYGVSPCAAMSMLQADGLILACEGDVEGALSMLAQTAVGGESPYLFDLSQVDVKEDQALLWHCGVAPANLWDGRSERTLDTYFAGGRGVTADFVLAPGEISILRLDSDGSEQRVFLQRATGLPTERMLKGTYLNVRFHKPVGQVLEELIDNGIAHHASMVYGSYVRPFQILAKIKGWRLIGQEPVSALTLPPSPPASQRSSAP